MKKYLVVLILAVSMAQAEEQIKIPTLPNADGLSKAVSAPKADCNSCGEVQTSKFKSPYVSEKIINEVQSLKANIACNEGKKRLSNDVSFYINGGTLSGSKIGGNWQSGFLNTGTVSDLHVGVSAFKDLMFITKVTNAGKVVGYNVTLSYCEVPSAIASLPAVVSNDRQISNFQAPNGIILGSSSNCGYGVVEYAANTVVTSHKSKDAHTVDAQVPTSFTKPSCANSKF